MSCDFFPRHFTDDTGLMHFSAFFALQMTWEFAFFWVCPTTPMSSAGTITPLENANCNWNHHHHHHHC